MRITIAAVGKMKASPEQELLRHYLKRIPWSLTLHEVEAKASLPVPQRRETEAHLLLDKCRDAHKIIALDERGKNLSSETLAGQIGDWQGQGCSHLAFIIGGQDGLDAAVRQKADLVLCFGALTWPHMLVRAMLSEQIYRVHTILSGHPYHRS